MNLTRIVMICLIIYFLFVGGIYFAGYVLTR